MKRVVLLIILLMIVGCGVKSNVRDVVSNYLNLYINLDDHVVKQLTEQANRYYRSNLIRDKYIEVLKRQYSNMEYEIVGESYDGDFAFVTVRVDVYDLYKAQVEATDNVDEFVTPDGGYDREDFNLYKLDKMYEIDDKVSYDVVLKLLFSNNKWEVLQLSSENLEKLHGIYNYQK